MVLYLMGIDVGSTVCKTTIYDYEGRIVSATGREYEDVFIYPREDWCEYDPEKFWKIIARCISDCIRIGKLNPKDIVALSVSVSGESIIPIGRDGKPVYNGINWTDRRSKSYEPQREEINRKLGTLRIYEITGYPLNPVPSSVRILWLKDERADVYNRVWKFMLWEDFVNWKLTGEAVLSYSTASSSQLFDIRRRKWSSEILEALDINADLLSNCMPSGKVVGEVCLRASEETGLSKGTLVATGGWDQTCGALGAGVLEEGQACNTTGTVECVTPVVKNPVVDEKTLSIGLYCSPHVAGESYVYFAWFPTSGAILKWFRDNFAEKEVEMADKTGQDVYDILTSEAAKSKPGANGLLLLPFFEGSGVGQPPAFNIDARGVLIGLRLYHKKSDVIRAILEGVAFQTRIIIEKIEELGINIRELRAIGGGAKSKLWMQIKADVTNKKIVLPDVTEAGTLGAAILASVAGKVYTDVERAVRKMCREKSIFHPRAETAETYSKYYSVYKELYPNLLPVFNKMASL